MNEQAIRLEEKIISLFSNLETEIYQGWVLKDFSCHTVVFPLYSGSLSRQEVEKRIGMCEEISRQKSLNCQFRIVENTNYYLTSILEDKGYKLRHSAIIAECCMDENVFLPGQGQWGKNERDKVVLHKRERGNGIEHIVTDSGLVVGVKRQGLLFLPDGKLPGGVEIEDIFLFAAENRISRVLADIPENEELTASYRETGFRKAYLYRCYQREGLCNESAK